MIDNIFTERLADTYITVILLGYLLGSIPFGLILTMLTGQGDIRKIGSGNIGATNVLRTGNKTLALATLLLDSGKGAAAVLIAKHMFPDTWHVVTGNSGGSYNDTMILACMAGFSALIGHCYPVWLKFKGGKGVATVLGTLIALAPFLGIITCGIWLVTALLFRISSLAALVAVGLTPVITYHLNNDPSVTVICALIIVVVYAKHRENIKRLFQGQEPKIGNKKKETK